MVHEPVNGHTLLLLTNQEELLRGVIISCSLGSTDHVAVADPLLFRESAGRVLTAQESKQQLIEGKW